MPDMPDPERPWIWDADNAWTREQYRSAGQYLVVPLSVLDEGGRLVVEAPCEHGVFHDSCDQLVCGHDHLLTDGWYPDAKAECWCPGGSRRQVWPNDKETA